VKKIHMSALIPPSSCPLRQTKREAPFVVAFFDKMGGEGRGGGAIAYDKSIAKRENMAAGGTRDDYRPARRVSRRKKEKETGKRSGRVLQPVGRALQEIWCFWVV
jgi:hypothetical protein